MASMKIKISVAQVIGHMISSLPAVEYGPLCYRKLEKDRTMALSKAKGNVEASMILSDEAK